MRKKIILFLILTIIIMPVSVASNSKLETNSRNIIAIDRNSLSVIYEKNGYDSVPMASTTKIMTCIIAIENSSLTEIVTVSKNASSVTGSTLGLKENQKISMNDLLYGLMLRSGNDCAIAISEHISQNVNNFVALMNQKASELKLDKTNYVTPHGLDNMNHYTSAYDLAILTNYALKNDTFRKIVSTKYCVIYIDNRATSIKNTNELLGVVDGVYGVKTGFTFNAGRCLVSVCKRNNLDLIVVVLGADTKNIRTQDSKKIISYIFDNYEYINIKQMLDENLYQVLNKYSSQITLFKTSTTPTFYLEPQSTYEYLFLKNEVPELKYKIIIQKSFSSNILPNSIVGTVTILNHDKFLCKTNILLKNNLYSNHWTFYYKKCLLNLF